MARGAQAFLLAAFLALAAFAGARAAEVPRVASSSGFNAALDGVVAGAATRTALMCAEEDPRRCHRRFLLTPPLLARGVGVRHVRGDGRVEDEADIARAAAPPQGDLFRA